MAISGKNLIKKVNMPKARRNSAMSVGACKVARASSLRGSGEIPSALTVWPRNLIESVEIVHLSGLRTTPASARSVWDTEVFPQKSRTQKPTTVKLTSINIFYSTAVIILTRSD